MESIFPLSLSDFPEDVQNCIISFLHQSDLEAFASTSKKFLALCNNDERLWFLKCSRRWGSKTQIEKWGGGKISYRNLFHLLNQYENLIGFWNYNYSGWNDNYYGARNSAPGELVLFEWGSFYITGYRLLPSTCRGYEVEKKPFLWITATCDGQTLNYLDTNKTLPLTVNDLSSEDSEKLRRPELILVDIHLSEDRCLTLRENRQFLEFRKLLDTGSGREEYEIVEIVFRSPPDGLMAKIYEILARNPSSKKERRQREQQRRVSRWRTEHFLKIMNPFPTPSRPLQGLWKGIGPNKSLNFYLVTYKEYHDYIWCQVVGSYSRDRFYCEKVFLTRTTAFTPLSSEEEHTYDTRSHLRPIAQSDQAEQDRRSRSSDDEDLDVLGICNAFSPHYPYHRGSFENPDGRVWLYANGMFGFGFLRDDYIVDLKPIVKNGHLVDAI